MAQLLDRIDASLTQTRDEYEIAELLAKKATYLARVGRFDDSRSLVNEVRQTFNDGRSGRVTCLIQVAEGVLHHHNHQHPAALDKFNRALFLAQALKQTDLIGLCAAWQAFIDFDQSRFESMQRALLLVRDLGLDQDHAVQSRFAVTVMVSTMFVGERVQAQKWFRLGHSHAVADGDQACIDGLLFNRAVFGLARQRVAWCSGQLDRDWAQTIRAELHSAANLQQLVGIATLTNHVDLCLARLDLIEGRFIDGLRLIDQVAQLDGFAGKHVNSTALSVERVFALAQLGREQEAAKLAKSLDLSELEPLDPDERLVAFKMLSMLPDTIADHEGRRMADAKLAEARSDYEAIESRLRNAIGPWLA